MQTSDVQITETVKELYIKASYFKGLGFNADESDQNEFFIFGFGEGCPQERAAEEAFKTKASAYIADIRLIESGKRFKTERYGIAVFKEDYIQAQAVNFDDSIIRTIKILE